MVLRFAFIGIVTIFVLRRAYLRYLSLLKNIDAAKRSHIPYVVLPLYSFNRAWLTTWRLFLPLLRLLPKAWKEPWIKYETSLLDHSVVYALANIDRSHHGIVT